MRYFLHTVKRKNFVILFLVVAVYAGAVVCSGFSTQQKVFQKDAFSEGEYAGSLSCKACHRNIYDSFVNTAHHSTSAPANGTSIKGSFDANANRFPYNKFTEVIMEKKEDGFYQTAYINGVVYQSERMDISIGSGRKGQTYLYWKGNELLQLPVSYYTPSNSWCNSPGYPKSMVRFNRITPARCIECHGSAAISETDEHSTYFDQTSIGYGVNCERCHGPSADHVAFHTANPQATTAKFVFTKNVMTRQQKLDVCALCHSGIREAIKPAFSFIAGDRLEDFSRPKYSADTTAQLDVHGNQYGLLTSSKCFQGSQMNCSSCHNVHETAINQPAAYSAKCITCHYPAAKNECTQIPQPGLILSNNCIDCHMPSLPSKAIFLQLSEPEKSTPDFVRTHRIAIYPEFSKAFIKKIAGKK